MSEIYFNLGKAYYNSEKFIQAREAFNQTIQLNPQFGLAYYYQGMINEKIMNFDEAIEVKEMAAQKRKINTIGDLENIVKMTLRSSEKTLLIVIYNNLNQKRYIGVKLD